jgi:HPt (histidine-containing phosphotransfer) domain-containing protein
MSAANQPSPEPRESVETKQDEQVLDLESSLKRLGGDSDILIELAKMFAEDSPGLIESIVAGIDAARWKDVSRAAHNLRGLAANFGAARLISRLKQLEVSAAQGNRDRSLILVDEIRGEKFQLESALAAYAR